MTMSNDRAERVGVLVLAGMLGAGFDPATVERGLRLAPDVIAVDGGSTDSGPFYLGSGEAKTTAHAVARDLRILLRAAATAHIPLIIGSCGTSGADSGVDWVADIAESIIADERFDLGVARIYSEQTADELEKQLHAGRILPLAPATELSVEMLESCSRIVAMMGHEPIVEALRQGADVVLAGRATDTAVAAAVPLLLGMPPGPTWHASKIIECGSQCTTSPRSGGVFASIDRTGFTIEPLNPTAACTPASVAAHMLYETANPYQMREPAGTLVVSEATYIALDERRVRVEGSRFEPAEQHTIKLEGASACGFQTVCFAGVRDPHIVANIETWATLLRTVLTERVAQTLGLAPSDYAFDIRLYGHNAILENLDPDPRPAREVGVMLIVNAVDQTTATAVAKLAKPLMLHLPLPDMAYLPSLAFATSPAEIERGATYEFVVNHVVEVDSPTSMFRIQTRATAHG
ncbi:MAG TPA: acyclic terpene utilization AtuA family protein [Kribbella sp.]